MGTVVDTEEGFSAPDVCVLAGISYRQLDYWARTDFIRPSLKDASGSGSARRYSVSDVDRLIAVKSALDAGISLRRLRRMLNHGHDLAAAINAFHAALGDCAECRWKP
jgi:DNA-binding transcriptional MerR regulator